MSNLQDIQPFTHVHDHLFQGPASGYSLQQVHPTDLTDDKLSKAVAAKKGTTCYPIGGNATYCYRKRCLPAFMYSYVPAPDRSPPILTLPANMAWSRATTPKAIWTLLRVGQSPAWLRPVCSAVFPPPAAVSCTTSISRPLPPLPRSHLPLATTMVVPPGLLRRRPPLTSLLLPRPPPKRPLPTATLGTSWLPRRRSMPPSRMPKPPKLKLPKANRSGPKAPSLAAAAVPSSPEASLDPRTASAEERHHRLPVVNVGGLAAWRSKRLFGGLHTIPEVSLPTGPSSASETVPCCELEVAFKALLPVPPNLNVAAPAEGMSSPILKITIDKCHS